MRKPQEFCIQPLKATDTTVTIQSDKAIGRFDLKTGKGMLNTKGCYFPHLNPALGAVEYTLSEEDLTEIKKRLKAAGSVIRLGGGGVQADNSGSANL